MQNKGNARKAEAVPAEKLRAEIDTTLALVKAEPLDRALLLLRIVEQAGLADQPSLLRYVAEQYEHSESSNEIVIDPIVNPIDYRNLVEKYGSLVDGMLDLIFADNPEVDDFYEQVANLLKNPLFPDEVKRGFALHWFLVDKRTPYFHLERGMRLSNDDWRFALKSVRTQRARMRFIMQSHFDQKTEKADLLLKELDAVEGVERVTLMAYLVWEYEDQYRRAAKASE